MSFKMFLRSTLLPLLAIPAIATVSDVPSINPPIPRVMDMAAVNTSAYFKRQPSDFEHPGLWHTHDDLETARQGVLSGTEPWASTFTRFSLDKYSQSNYTMQGPHSVISRGSISNYTSFANDARAAWQNAWMWYITKNHSHWERSASILDAWGSNLTSILGTDRSLLIGLDGDLFANAAEIMRWEGNWTEAGSSWRGGSGLSIQLYWLFAKQSVPLGQANYGMVSIKALMSFAVYLDDVQLWNYAVDAYIQDNCAGVFGTYQSDTGQSIESGRDQGHAMSGLGWAALAGRVGSSQGVDLYGLGDDLLLKGAEYTAQYNLNQSVEFDPSWFRCEAVLVGGPWGAISEEKRGVTSENPMWDILYYEFVKRRGVDAPWTSRAKREVGVEGAVAGNDQPSWGDLIWAY
ncbi:uncharacterized protein BDV14DRAFT_198288 [Aspergillus stella-maris]|uniref:uncharacterized protein n=1 Tax=Aspergillus stella-maris TaxID=1810926 RepID=UPI003CCCB0C9